MIKIQDLQRIIDRQVRFDWGDEYKPSTLATTREGSRISRISRLNSARLGRTLHLQSTAETLFTKFALYNPRVFDLHEQKMISPVRHRHPLDGHSSTLRADLPYLEGSLTIARRIGFKHHQIVVEMGDGSKIRVPYPYQGDLLLYLTDEKDMPYALNWNLKVTHSDFLEKNRGRVKTPFQQGKSKANQVLRNELEEQYYASGGIRTLKLTPEDIDRELSANIDLMFSFHLKHLTVDGAILTEYSHDLQEAIRIGVPPASIAIRYGKRWGDRDQFIAKIYKDIWDRKLLVSLFEPVRIDHPLAPQAVDALELYKDLFAETSP